VTRKTPFIAKTGPSLTASTLGALILLSVVLVLAYLLSRAGSHIGSGLAVLVILAGFLVLVPMIAETIVAKKIGKDERIDILSSTS
jgi:hypothetical protein